MAFEEWYAIWKAASPLRQGPDHPAMVNAMRTAWDAGQAQLVVGDDAGTAEIEESLNTLAVEGKMEVQQTPDGPRYKMTPEGMAEAERLIQGWGIALDDPDMLNKLKEKGFFD